MLKTMSKLPTHSKPISLVMKSRNSELQDLFQKMYEINRLKKYILPQIDEAFRAYIDVSYDFKQTLILIVANDAIATRLHFQTPELLLRFQKHPYLNKIKKINLKIQSFKRSKLRKDTPSVNQVARLTEESAKTMHSLAETITHPGLKTIMQRIAKRVKQDAN